MPPLLHSLGLKLCGTSSSQFVSQDLAIQRQKQNHAQTKSKNPWKAFQKPFQVSTKTPAVCNPHKNYSIKINPARRQDYEEKLWVPSKCEWHALHPNTFEQFLRHLLLAHKLPRLHHGLDSLDLNWHYATRCTINYQRQSAHFEPWRSMCLAYDKSKVYIYI